MKASLTRRAVLLSYPQSPGRLSYMSETEKSSVGESFFQGGWWVGMVKAVKVEILNY